MYYSDEKAILLLCFIYTFHSHKYSHLQISSFTLYLAYCYMRDILLDKQRECSVKTLRSPLGTIKRRIFSTMWSCGFKYLTDFFYFIEYVINSLLFDGLSLMT